MSTELQKNIERMKLNLMQWNADAEESARSKGRSSLEFDERMEEINREIDDITHQQEVGMLNAVMSWVMTAFSIPVGFIVGVPLGLWLGKVIVVAWWNSIFK